MKKWGILASFLTLLRHFSAPACPRNRPSDAGDPMQEGSAQNALLPFLLFGRGKRGKPFEASAAFRHRLSSTSLKGWAVYALSESP